eukprot:8774132-Pyramimonas_sp.AAC.1
MPRFLRCRRQIARGALDWPPLYSGPLFARTLGPRGPRMRTPRLCCCTPSTLAENNVRGIEGDAARSPYEYHVPSNVSLQRGAPGT